jgi:O-methyltransferase domain/Dimerisation domain
MVKVNSADRIIELGFGFMASKTVLSAVELGLFTGLARGPMDCEALRRKLGLHRRGARDFFDALVAMGLLRRRGARYSNAPESARFLDRSNPDYVGGILEMCNARLYPFWGSLTEGLRTGKPQNEIKAGEELFDALYADRQALKAFCKAMTGRTLPAARAIARKFPWRSYQTFADIGTSEGALPVQVALAHKHLICTGFDLPPVRPLFEEYTAAKRVSDRVSFQAGDFFKDPLPRAQVLSMGAILHDWNLAEKRRLIAKAYDALPKGGAFIVFEWLIDDARSKRVAALMMSLNMLIESQGGFDFSGADCRRWMREAGFSRSRVEHLAGPVWMVVGIK